MVPQANDPGLSRQVHQLARWVIHLRHLPPLVQSRWQHWQAGPEAMAARCRWMRALSIACAQRIRAERHFVGAIEGLLASVEWWSQDEFIALLDDVLERVHLPTAQRQIPEGLAVYLIGAVLMNPKVPSEYAVAWMVHVRDEQLMLWPSVARVRPPFSSAPGG